MRHQGSAHLNREDSNKNQGFVDRKKNQWTGFGKAETERRTSGRHQNEEGNSHYFGDIVRKNRVHAWRRKSCKEWLQGREASNNPDEQHRPLDGVINRGRDTTRSHIVEGWFMNHDAAISRIEDG